MPIGEEGKARAFFGELLGMKEEHKPEPLASRGGCWFRSTGTILHLGVEKEFAPQRKTHPAFCVAALDALSKRLTEAGYPVTWDSALPDRQRFHTCQPLRESH